MNLGEKILFFDIEGVLNQNNELLNHKCLDVLSDIVYETGSKLVIISSIKKFYQKQDDKLDIIENGSEVASQLLAGLYDYGLEIIDKTPDLGTIKGKEIAAWLASHNEVETFVILSNNVYQFPNYQNTNLYLVKDGLKPEDVQSIINLLNINDNNLLKVC